MDFLFVLLRALVFHVALTLILSFLLILALLLLNLFYSFMQCARNPEYRGCVHHKVGKDENAYELHYNHSAPSFCLMSFAAASDMQKYMVIIIHMLPNTPHNASTRAERMRKI